MGHRWKITNQYQIEHLARPVSSVCETSAPQKLVEYFLFRSSLVQNKTNHIKAYLSLLPHPCPMPHAQNATLKTILRYFWVCIHLNGDNDSPLCCPNALCCILKACPILPVEQISFRFFSFFFVPYY
jgi:hypothetical protein